MNSAVIGYPDEQGASITVKKSNSTVIIVVAIVIGIVLFLLLSK